MNINVEIYACSAKLFIYDFVARPKKYSEGVTDDKSCRSSLENGSHKIKHTEPLCEDISGIF